MDLQRLSALEDKITTAVELIRSLRQENQELRDRLKSLEGRTAEKDEQIARLKSELEDFQRSAQDSREFKEREEKLRQRLGRLVDPKEDNVRLYRFCQDCGTKLETFGTGKPTEEPDVYVL